MAKRRYGKKRRSGGSKKMPLAIMVPLAITGLDVGRRAVAGDYANAKYIMTGVTSDGHFDSGRFLQTYVPIGAGVVIHKMAGKFGVNRYIPKWIPVSI